MPFGAKCPLEWTDVFQVRDKRCTRKILKSGKKEFLTSVIKLKKKNKQVF